MQNQHLTKHNIIAVFVQEQVANECGSQLSCFNIMPYSACAKWPARLHIHTMAAVTVKVYEFS